MKTITTFLSVFVALISTVGFAQDYKDLMNDYSVNFYEVVAEAESYFASIDTRKKGSGLKQFERWRNENEPLFYPSGDRSQFDPLYARKAFDSYQKNYPTLVSQSKNRLDGWRELGPNSVDNITGHYAAGIGRIEEAQIDLSNPAKIYIGSRSGGLWRTLDEGATWVGGSTDFLPASGVNTIAIDPADSDHIVLNVRNAKNGTSYGLYESTDGGATVTETAFNPVNLGMGGLGSDFRINRVKYHPTIPNMVLIGTSEGIYKSTDNLTSWVKVEDIGSFFFIEFHPTDATIVYATNINGGASNRNFLYKSDDTGDSFSKTTEVSSNNSSRGYIAVASSEPNSVWWGSDSGVWKSDDQGETFAFINTAPSGTNIRGFAVNSTNTANLIAGYVDMFSTEDGGASFEQRTWWDLNRSEHGPGSYQERYINSTKYIHADTNIAYCFDGVFYAMTDGTLAKSEDGGITWENLMRSGVGVRENYKLGVSQSNKDVSISGSQDNGTSIKNTEGWIEYFGADGMEGIVHPLNPELMIGSFQRGGRIKTIDGGLTNSSATISGSTDGFWEAPLAYDPNDHLTVYDFRNAVHKSEDFGETHTLIGAPNGFTTINQAEIAQNNSDIMVLTGSDRIEKSTDGGATFTDIKGSLPNFFITDVAFDPTDDDTIIVVNTSIDDNGQKVFITTDGGTAWSNITFNIGNIPVHTVVIDHTSEKNIYLGTEVGIFTKPMSGDTWALYNTDLPNTAIEELEIVWGANIIKAATWGRGLWEFDLVGRASYPSIDYTEITTPPTETSPKAGEAQFVTSVINYSGTLSGVKVIWSQDTPSLENEIGMTNTTGSTWVSETAIPDFPVGTKVYFKVVATGSAGDESETYQFMYAAQEANYCSAEGAENTGGDWINQVTVNDFVNPSENDSYTLYDDVAPIILAQGATHTTTIQLASVFDGDDAGAWIDFNNNLEFEASEEITMSAYENNISTGTFTVPEGAVIGQLLRMRVRNSFFGDAIPCGSDAGEVEDYLVLVPAANDYCEAAGTENTGGDFIDRVTIGDFVNESEQTFYTFYEDLGPINLLTGASYETTIRLGTVFDGDSAGAWIDYNNDAIFTEDERITMSAYDGNTSTGSFTIPSGAVQGVPLRMRVRNSFFDAIAQPCGEDAGEVEDYLILITDELADYCIASGAATTGADWISQVSIDMLVNDSENDSYTFYDALSPVEMIIGNTYQTTVTLNTVFDGDQAGAWIDFNNNLAFEEGERIVMSAYENTVATGTIVVPSDAVANVPLRMRVRNSFFGDIVEPCGENSGEVEDYQIIINSNEYCTASGTENTGGDYINRVTIGDDVVNDSGKDSYTFYEDIGPAVLILGESYETTIQLNAVFDGDDAGAWIDFNDNMIFDAGEEITMSLYDAATNVSTGVITVPEDAVTDVPLRMRVRNSFFDAEAQPCGDDAGEVEDYLVLILADEYCSAMGTDNTGADYINSVTIGPEFVNNTGQDAYTFYEDLGPVVLTMGTVYETTIQLNALFDLDKAGAWIDFNDNGLFDSEEEIIMSGYDAATLVATGSIVIPEDAVLGEALRMRVRNSYFDEVALPCGDDAGEVEDYLVLVEEELSVSDTETGSFTVYPNPSVDKIFISSSSEQIERIVLFDLNGRKVLDQNVQSTSYTLDIRTLPQAMYFLHIQTKDSVSVQKVMKN